MDNGIQGTGIQGTGIQTVKPSTATLIEAMYDSPDYRDAFLVSPPLGMYETVADFARAYFLNQPRWLGLVSMNLLSSAKLVEAVGDGAFDEGSNVGSWTVHRRGDDEIVFGDDMGFMEYRFGFLMRADGEIEASTAVRYRWKRVSRFYFAMVKPMHRRFVPMSLRATLPAQRSLVTT